MKELIKITEQDGKQAVSARELHAFLGSKQKFVDWIKNRINKYGLIENHDYTSFHKIMKREKGSSVLSEYALTIDCAKELAMVEGNEKGKQARKYFIECEKKLKDIAKSFSQLEIMQQSLNILLEQERRLMHMEKDIKNIKAITTRPNFYTVVGYATSNNLIVSLKQAANIGRKASVICKKRGIDTDTIPDPRFGLVNTYPVEVLTEVFTHYQ